jgi:hypothetical protein
MTFIDISLTNEIYTFLYHGPFPRQDPFAIWVDPIVVKGQLPYLDKLVWKVRMPRASFTKGNDLFQKLRKQVKPYIFLSSNTA